MHHLRCMGSKSLYLYGGDDPLCDAAKLDELIASRRHQAGSSQAGSADVAAADVAAVRWQRSQHVAHLLQHPKEYKAALFGFLESIAKAAAATNGGK